jgi:hypothetical protein
MKLWTICCIPSLGDDPLVDICYCDHEPTVDEVREYFTHLEEFDEDCFWIQEYSAPSPKEPVIPTIKD